MKLYVVYEYEVEDRENMEDPGGMKIVGACTTKETALRMIEDAANKRYNSLNETYIDAEKPVFTVNGWRAQITAGVHFYDIMAMECEDGIINDDFLGS